MDRRDENQDMTDIAEEVQRTADDKTDMQPTGPDDQVQTDMEPTPARRDDTNMQPTGPDERAHTEMQPPGTDERTQTDMEPTGPADAATPEH